MNLNPKRTAVLISPIGKGGGLFANAEEMENVDISDKAVLNGGTGLKVKGGLNGPNELPDKDDLNNLTSGTKEGPVDLTVTVNDG